MARSRPTDATDAHRRRILDAAEAVLRRQGPAKTTVVDVAREIGQSHASVYRYFASKADLIDALVGRWLDAVSTPLDAIARGGEGSASDRLRAWLLALIRTKVRKVTGDPGLFAAYHSIALESHDVAAYHVATLVGQLESIVAAGVAAGEFRVADPALAARSALNATARFHHPALLAHAAPPPDESDAEAVIALLLAGLRAGVL